LVDVSCPQIATLDVLQSLARVPSLSQDVYTRPQFSVDTTGIKKGRHPILEKSSGPAQAAFVPNDTVVSL
jgi:DNA mismatch repair ATPase MutS